MNKNGWHKIASVTAGGKPYFWNLWKAGKLIGTVVWSQVYGQWLGYAYVGPEHFQMLVTWAKTMASTKSITMKWIQKNAKQYGQKLRSKNSRRTKVIH